ncbi:hypothetical protein CsSME_00023654 [Camellia sinensis var. sinensis]
MRDKRREERERERKLPSAPSSVALSDSSIIGRSAFFVAPARAAAAKSRPEQKSSGEVNTVHRSQREICDGEWLWEVLDEDEIKFCDCVVIFRQGSGG